MCINAQFTSSILLNRNVGCFQFYLKKRREVRELSGAACPKRSKFGTPRERGAYGVRGRDVSERDLATYA